MPLILAAGYNLLQARLRTRHWLKQPYRWAQMIVLQIIAVMFVATAVRSALGFGEALIAVPILSLIIPVRIAAPIAVVASILVSSFIVCRDWRHIQFKSAKRLIVSTLFGIPLGLLLLKFAPESIVKGLLGFIILAYSLFFLTARKTRSLRDDRFAWFFGFFAGVFGGAYGMNGPPLAIYGSLRGWDPREFRATLQSYFLPASLMGVIGYGVAHLLTPSMLHLTLWSLPAIAFGIVTGQFIHTRLNYRAFTRFLNIGLALIGLALLIQSLVHGR